MQNRLKSIKVIVNRTKIKLFNLYLILFHPISKQIGIRKVVNNKKNNEILSILKIKYIFKNVFHLKLKFKKKIWYVVSKNKVFVKIQKILTQNKRTNEKNNDNCFAYHPQNKIEKNHKIKTIIIKPYNIVSVWLLFRKTIYTRTSAVYR